MKVFWAPYHLLAQAPVNSQTSDLTVRGVLLQVLDREKRGYSCLQSWPQLGEVSIDQELKWLAEGLPSNKVKWLLELAAVDASFRVRGESVWQRTEPKLQNHLLVSHLSDLAHIVRPPSNPESGRIYIKVKLGKNWREWLDLLKSFKQGFGQVVSSNSPYTSAGNEDGSQRSMLKSMDWICWRIDFNESLTFAEYLDFCEAVQLQSDPVIDFVEDPFPYDVDSWLRAQELTSIPLARDVRTLHPQDQMKLKKGDYLAGAQVIVIKPLGVARWLWPSQHQLAGRPLVFTSNLDHPLGQLQGLWAAQEYYRQENIPAQVCGFQSAHIWQRTPYSDCLQEAGNILLGAPGTGFGFDALLQQEDWREIQMAKDFHAN